VQEPQFAQGLPEFSTIEIGVEVAGAGNLDTAHPFDLGKIVRNLLRKDPRRFL
jgi:hypothetical protein